MLQYLYAIWFNLLEDSSIESMLWWLPMGHSIRTKVTVAYYGNYVVIIVDPLPLHTMVAALLVFRNKASSPNDDPACRSPTL